MQLWGGKQYTGMKISISILVWWNAVTSDYNIAMNMK